MIGPILLSYCLAHRTEVEGIGAQRPYDLGVAEALATSPALTGHEPTPWIALPALAITRFKPWRSVRRTPAPVALRELLKRLVKRDIWFVR